VFNQLKITEKEINFNFMSEKHNKESDLLGTKPNY